MTWLRLFKGHCHRASQQKNWPYDDSRNHGEGDELRQVIGLGSIGVSITEETRSANVQRTGNFHGNN
jgi:hypothetical protein